MTQNSKAWLTLDEIAEVVEGEYWSAGSHSPMAIPPSVAKDVAQRIAKASMDKALRLQEKDPTVAAAERVSQKFRELNEALDAMELPDNVGIPAGYAHDRVFQGLRKGLQEASKDLVDLEIVIPAGHTTDPEPLGPLPFSVEYRAPKLLDMHPTTPYGPQAALYRASRVAEVRSEMLRAIRESESPAPWYKRLWSLFWNRRHEPLAVSMDRLYDARQALIHPFVDVVGGAPFRLWSWLTGPEDKPLTDYELQEATEQLDRALRLPWYKRIPAFILWLWRLP